MGVIGKYKMQRFQEQHCILVGNKNPMIIGEKKAQEIKHCRFFLGNHHKKHMYENIYICNEGEKKIIKRIYKNIQNMLCSKNMQKSRKKSCKKE